MTGRRRTVAIAGAIAFVAMLLFIVVPIVISVRQQRAAIESITSSGAEVLSFWLPGDAPTQKTPWILTPAWYLTTFVPQPQGVCLNSDTNLRVFRTLEGLPTVECISSLGEDFASGRGKNIIDRLITLPHVRNLSFVDCNDIAQPEFDALTHIEVLSIMRPGGNGCASLALTEEWPRLRVLSIIEATVCENDLTYPTESLIDCRFAACRFEPGEFRNLSRFSDLRRLSLYRTEIPDFNINVLSLLPNLEELELSTAAIDGSDVRELIGKVPSLRELVLPFDWTDEQILAMTREFPSITISRCNERIMNSFWGRPRMEVDD